MKISGLLLHTIQFSTYFVKRRKFVASATLLTTALAGCGSPSENSTDNQSTEQSVATPGVNLSGPTSVAVDEEVTLTVTYANDTNETVDFQGTVAVSQGNSDFTEQVSLDEIPAGEEKSTQIGPITFRYADEYQLQIADGEGTHTLTVEPISAHEGEPLALGNSIQMTATDFLFYPSLFYSEGGADRPNSVFSAPSGKILAAIEVEVENVGTESKSAPLDAITVQNGELYSSIGSESLESITTIPGTPIGTAISGALEPSQVVQGWLLAQVDQDAAKDGISLVYQRDASDTPPEKQWDLQREEDSQSFPTFTIDGIQRPDELRTGEEFQTTIAVENTGDTTGVFRGVVEYKDPDTDEWRLLADPDVALISGEIRPDQTREFSVRSRTQYTTTLTYRLQPTVERWEFTFDPGTLSLNDTFVTPGNNEITVDEIRQARELETSYDNKSSSTLRTADDGNRFIIAHIRNVATTGIIGSERAVMFKAITPNGQEVEHKEWPRPLAADWYGDGGGIFTIGRGLDQGDTVEGWLVFEVPEETTAENVAIDYLNERGPFGASVPAQVRWSSRFEK